VMYLLDADAGLIPDLRRRLSEIGNSVVVVGGDRLWNVHVHCDDAGQAVEAGMSTGRPHRISVTHLSSPRAGLDGVSRPIRTLVSVAAGAGLAKVVEESGAVVVGSVGEPPTPADYLDAILSAHVSEVVVLPNDERHLGAAEEAAEHARGQGVAVAVIPTRSQVQGLSAAAVHDPGRRFEDDVAAMSAAAGQTRYGAVTLAEPAPTARCVAGELQGEVVVVSYSVVDAAVEIATRLLTGGGELLTLVTGQGVPAELADAVASRIQQARPGVETAVYEGGQPFSQLLIAVE